MRTRDGRLASLHLLLAPRAENRLGHPRKWYDARKFLRRKKTSLAAKGNLITVAQDVNAERKWLTVDAKRGLAASQ
jgi:hypothetical protein